MKTKCSTNRVFYWACFTIGALGMLIPVMTSPNIPLPVAVVRNIHQGKFAFSSPVDGLSQEIVVMGADGSSRRSVSNHPGVDIHPVWSPDGTRLAFCSFREGSWGVYMSNEDGSGQKLVAPYALDPSWSPDGRKLVFSCTAHSSPSHPVICTSNIDGTDHKTLTNGRFSSGHPTWSPDGMTIAYDCRIGKDSDIYTIRADGGTPRQITDDPGNDTSPAWSPDGRYIAFETDRHRVENDPKLDKNIEVYLMKANGSSQKRLTEEPGADIFPTWSPDGHYILFGYSIDKKASLYVMTADGKSRTKIGHEKDTWDYAPASWTYR